MCKILCNPYKIAKYYKIIFQQITKEDLKNRNRIAKIKIEEHPDIVVTCSCGLAVAPKDGETVAELYKAADSALYIAKSLGKNKLAKF